MDSTLCTADVAIVGAGTTGAAAAWACARRGLRAVCLERRGLEEAGAHWVNGVPAEAFDRAGLDRPEAPELLASGVDFHLIAGWGPERVIIREHDLMEVDMRRLVERLQAGAQAAGAEFFGQTRVEHLDVDGLQTSRGRVDARWVVDASGLAGARLLDHPRPAPEDICAAAQQVRRVADRSAAEAVCREHGAEPGETLCFSGIEGGYSILNVRVEDDRVALLTGSIPAAGWRPGRTILREFADQNAWIGEPIFGGSRAIPLRRPYERLRRGNVAVIGDAACQVFAAHGSGIGPGLVAARLLADALADGRGLRGYEHDWQRSYGGLFAGYAVFRRFIQELTPADLARLMRAGLMDAELAAQGLLQRFPQPDARLVAGKLGAALRAPDLAARMMPVLAQMAGAKLLYAGYPTSEKKRGRWTRLVDRACGRPPAGGPA